jgi:16S rRNA (guanine527-N7)-methyltransferase
MDQRVSILIEQTREFLSLGSEAAATMLAYLDRILVENESINLTAITDPAEAVTRHLADSLAFGLHVRDAAPPKLVVDVGTGAGFPGVPIAIAWPETELHVIDGTRKKVQVVERVLDELRIPNVSVHWGRAEDLGRSGDLLAAQADAVTARAVGPLAEILARSGGLLAPGGCVISWKSAQLPDDERRDAADAARRLRMESLPDCEYQLDRKGRLVRYRRLA